MLFDALLQPPSLRSSFKYNLANFVFDYIFSNRNCCCLRLILFYFKQVISCNKNICTLQITDTTGSHQFPAMQRLSITKGHAFILVYSVCSKQSLEELRGIWTLIKELKGQEITQIPVMLVGNKCDENNLREVTELDGKAEAASWGVSFMETSAKNNINVTELFQVSL